MTLATEPAVKRSLSDVIRARNPRPPQLEVIEAGRVKWLGRIGIMRGQRRLDYGLIDGRVYAIEIDTVDAPPREGVGYVVYQPTTNREGEQVDRYRLTWEVDKGAYERIAADWKAIQDREARAAAPRPMLQFQLLMASRRIKTIRALYAYLAARGWQFPAPNLVLPPGGTTLIDLMTVVGYHAAQLYAIAKTGTPGPCEVTTHKGKAEEAIGRAIGGAAICATCAKGGQS